METTRLLVGLGLLLTVSCSTMTSNQVCKDNSVITVREGENTTIRCDGINAKQAVKWRVGHSNMTYEKATCVVCQNTCPKTCSSRDSKYEARRDKKHTNLTLIDYIEKQPPNTLVVCEQGSKTQHCSLNITRLIKVQSKVVTLHRDWSVTGNATLMNVDGRDVDCLWSWSDSNTGYSVKATYTQDPEQTGRNVSTCYLETFLNTTVEPVAFYIKVDPEYGQKRVGELKGDTPGNLTLDGCPTFVQEGSSLSCRCGHLTHDGWPPANVSWEGGDREAEENSSLLTIPNVQRKDHHDNVYRCRSAWGSSGEVVQYLNYTLRVAYGPDHGSVKLLADKTLNSSSENLITLNCTSGPVYPSALFNWSVPCAASSTPVTPFSSACVVLANVTEVTCVVSNSEFPGNNVTKRYTPGKITATHDDGLKEDETEEDAKSGLPLWVIIAIAAGLAAICLGIVIVVVVKRRNKTSTKRTRKWSSRNSRDDEFEEHINECYQTADAVRPATANRPEFEEHINECYQSADAVRPSAADSDRPEFEEFINDCYVSADAVTSPSAALRTPKQEVSALHGDVYAQIDKK